MRADQSLKLGDIMATGMGRRQEGLTMVELLVAMTIGLLVGLIVTQAYISGVTTQRSQNDMTRLQEAARFGFALLSKGIRNAGFRNTYSPGSAALEFCGTSTIAGIGVCGAQRSDYRQFG